MLSLKSFSTDEFPDPSLKGLDAVPKIQKLQPNIFATFVRDSNGNVLVMESIIENHCIVNIEVYWLMLEPSYRESRRKKGISHDREEMNLIERVTGYGHTVLEKTSDTRWKIQMKNLPTLPVIIQYFPKKNKTVAFVNMDGVLCELSHVFIHEYTLVGPVKSVEVFGTQKLKGKKIKEKKMVYKK